MLKNHSSIMCLSPGAAARARGRLVAAAGLALLAMVIGANNARATTLVEVSLEQQVEYSAVIARVVVEDVRTRLAENGRVYTYAELRVAEVYKGAGFVDVARPVVAKQLGGEFGQLQDPVEGGGRYTIGQELVVFLVPDYDSADPGFFTYGMRLGVYSVERAEAGGINRLVRQQDDGSHLLRARHGAPGHSADAIRVDELMEAVTAAPVLEDGPVPQSPRGYAEAMSVSDQVNPSFAIWDPPKRWARPDSGAPIEVFVNSYGFPTSATVTLEAAFDVAAAAWSRVPGSSLRVVNAGLTYVCGFQSVNRESDVSLDCLREIPGRGCRSGVIAIGGPRTYDGSMQYDGKEFKVVTSGDIVIQDVDDGSPCDLFGDKNRLAGVLAHELGHVIGLQHSSDPTATMYAAFHPGMETLADDDIAGARYLYGRPLAAPTVTGVEPAVGEVGVDGLQVTVSGTNLISEAGEANVAFGEGVTVTRVVAAEFDRVVVELSIGARCATGSRAVRVTTPLGESGPAPFEVVTLLRPAELRRVSDWLRWVWAQPSLRATKVEIWRKVGQPDDAGEWVLIDTLNAPVTSFTDWDGVRDTTYSYRLRNAVDVKKKRKKWIFSEWTEPITMSSATQP